MRIFNACIFIKRLSSCNRYVLMCIFYLLCYFWIEANWKHQHIFPLNWRYHVISPLHNDLIFARDDCLMPRISILHWFLSNAVILIIFPTVNQMGPNCALLKLTFDIASCSFNKSRARVKKWNMQGFQKTNNLVQVNLIVLWHNEVSVCTSELEESFRVHVFLDVAPADGSIFWTNS